jgi:dihydrofolate reductase
MKMIDARVTIHMATSLDGYIAREDGRVDWMETQDEFKQGVAHDPEYVRTFLSGIDCYVMGSRTYLTAIQFEAKGLGWAYGDKPVFVLTSRELVRTKPTVEFHSGDLREFFEARLNPYFKNIWVVGGGNLAGACVQADIADEVRYSVLPVLIGKGISFFEGLTTDVPLHLLEVKAYQNGIVALHYEINRSRETSR